MKIIDVRTRIASLVSVVVLVVQIAPARAAGGDRGEGTDERRRVELTFTKWITTPTATGALMQGFTGGDVAGDFTGEILARQPSADGRVIRIEAVYAVEAGDRSFAALMKGGIGETRSGEAASVSGAGLLEGVILAGWRTGDTVHVAFQTTTNCAGAPDARKCFEGTIRIERVPQD